MRRVILESPYAGNIPQNLEYLKRALRDSLLRGEAPFASHATVVYKDYGISKGMALGIKAAEAMNHEIEERSIGLNPAPQEEFESFSSAERNCEISAPRHEITDGTAHQCNFCMMVMCGECRKGHNPCDMRK